VIESLETRLTGAEDDITRLSDHRPVQINRDVLKVHTQPSEDFAVYTSSCRLGSETLVLGQICVRPSQLKVIEKDLEFSLDMSLPKDPKGMVRRDIQEEKERQVQGLLQNKIQQCLIINEIGQTLYQEDSMQIDSAQALQKTPLQIMMSLNVIQDNEQDGNLLCALSSVASDLLLQIYQRFEKGEQLVQKVFWSSIAFKSNSKVVIDPRNLQESSLSNNLLLTTGFSTLPYRQEQIQLSIDKGSNILRTSYMGAQSQSVMQLEYQNCVLSLKEMQDISQYVKN